MSKEAMKLALEVLKINLTLLKKINPYKGQEDLLSDSLGLTNKAITTLEAEQPAQQEPVDFASLLREAEELVREKPTWKRFIEGTPLSNDIAVWMTVFAQDVARRTSPPAQRTWVGLTFAEICECENDYLHIFARAIEAKLKEKNT